MPSRTGKVNCRRLIYSSPGPKRITGLTIIGANPLAMLHGYELLAMLPLAVALDLALRRAANLAPPNGLDWAHRVYR